MFKKVKDNKTSNKVFTLLSYVLVVINIFFFFFIRPEFQLKNFVYKISNFEIIISKEIFSDYAVFDSISGAALEHARRFDRGLTDISRDETASVALDERSLRENADRAVHSRHEAGDHRLARSGIARKDHVK